MDDKKSKIIVGSVLAVVVIFIISLIVIKSAQSSCELLSAKPNMNSSKLVNIQSSDLKSMMNFDGYIQYLATDEPNKSKGFVPLWVNKTTTHTPAKDSGDKSKTSTPEMLALNADCATISLYLSRGSLQEVRVDKITVELVTPSEGIKVCHIKAPNMQASAKKHYRCASQRDYDCVSEKDIGGGKIEVQTIAKLVIFQFEFEVDTIEADARKGKFSTLPEECH